MLENGSFMNAGTVPRAGRHEWIGLGVIALPCLLYSMDLTVLELAVPKLSADLKPTSSQLLWIMDIYGFLLAGFLLTMGTLGDRIGRRRLLLIGAAATGMQVAWLDRSGGLFDSLDQPPPLVVTTLTELAGRLG